MVLKLGINGFGRIGRAVFRLAYGDPEVQVTHINDVAPPATMAHLLKYDNVHGRFMAPVDHDEKGLLLEGVSIVDSATRDPKQLNWHDGEVEIVLECTGQFRDKASALVHLEQGAKKVLISAPGKDPDVTIVMGVNQDQLKASHQVVSNASCTTNCLAPVVKVLHEKFKVIHGTMTTVHSYTNDQRLLCGSHKDLRRARAGALSQIPTSTGAAKAIGEVMPELKGKLQGMAIRVPTPNVSLVDLVVEVEKSTDVQAVNSAFEEAAQGSLKNILDINHEPLVSSDYNGCLYSAVVDALSTQVIGSRLIKVLAWYDNEMAFSQRMLDLAKLMSRC
ncbi:MAG: type I glyceraldehyde-3-phosphate dehydrogenase [Deltaproteobacteria bacterium]|nr:type I glyceraldehyde-3-phosphate dehydrogenase [Deltaproteobacteria bacterium]